MPKSASLHALPAAALSDDKAASNLGLSPSLVSHHLRLLRAARLLSPERRGKQIFYRLHDAHIAHVIADMVAHVQEPEHEAAHEEDAAP